MKFYRFVTDRLPTNRGHYYCECIVDGELAIKEIIEFDGRSWGELRDFDFYDSFYVLGWLEPLPSEGISAEEVNKAADEYYHYHISESSIPDREAMIEMFIAGYKLATPPKPTN